MSAPPARSLIIQSIREQARDIRSFNFLPADTKASHVAFKPGQIAILRIDGEEPAYFAFASSPEDPELEILVKRTIGASVALFDMKEGEAVDLLGVTGAGFDLDAQVDHDLVFVAMGTGVAPLRSALRHVLKRRDQFGALVLHEIVERL